MQGTLELRADGALRDWRLLNNQPGGPDARKVDVETAAFALWGKGSGHTAASLLRTHAPEPHLPVVDATEYAGAFPVRAQAICLCLRFMDLL